MTEDNGDIGTDIDVRIDSKIPPEVWQDAVALVEKICSPLIEAGNLLTDRIRFFRFKTAIKTLQVAKRMAEETSAPLNEVPIKFLVPFLENCSLEEEDGDLVEKWARLLISASTNYKAQHPAFVNILSQIGSNEAVLLRHIWKTSKSRGYKKLETLVNLYREESIVYYSPKPISIDEFEKRGFLVMAGSMPNGANRESELSEKNIQSLLILERQNLIKIQAAEGHSGIAERGVFVVNAVLTPLGFDFVIACEDVDNDEPE